MKSIIERIDHYAKKIPEKCAITDGETDISYKVLEHASNCFAKRLIELNCERGDRVVVFAKKQALYIVGILGIFKSATIHVPLDPRLPEERFQYILNDIFPKVIITDEDLLPIAQKYASKGTTFLLVNELQSFVSKAKTQDIDWYGTSDGLPVIYDEDIAYCVYTSGSSGYPKGVTIQHKSTFDFFEGTGEFYDVDENSYCASFSPMHFDVFLIDMLFPLYQGARLYLYSDIIVPNLLFKVIEECSVTHFSAFGLMLGLIAQASRFNAVILPSLKTILTGTDVPDVKTVQKWMSKNKDVKVVNGYGPTEVTCASVAHVIKKVEPNRKKLYPIGKAYKHVTLFLIEDGEVIDTPEIPGELLIGGSQVMKGYWNLEKENKERLIEFNGINCYRTGDICKFLTDGNLFFIGRKDDEVKIGGYRVHLNEVQRVINSIQYVYGAEVVLIDSKYGEKILAAGILFENMENFQKERQVEQIRKRLAVELPNYMIPRQITILDKFPQLSTGKTDRKSLSSLLTTISHKQ